MFRTFTVTMNNDLTFALKSYSLKVRTKASRYDQILLHGPWNTEHIGREGRWPAEQGNGFSLSILPHSFDRSCRSLYFCRPSSLLIKILMHPIWCHDDFTITPNKILKKGSQQRGYIVVSNRVSVRILSVKLPYCSPWYTLLVTLLVSMLRGDWHNSSPSSWPH